MARLGAIVEDATFEVCATTIQKRALQARYAAPYNPYEIGLRFCMEHLLSYLLRNGRPAGSYPCSSKAEKERRPGS